jgi:hypothetical protein
VIEWWAVLLGFSIVARVTRFVTTDVLGDPIRRWMIGVELKPSRLPRPVSRPLRWIFRQARRPLHAVFGDGLETLAECPWCVSIWVSFVVVPLAVQYGDTWPFLIAGLICGMSYFYALLAQNLDGE